MFEDSQSKTSTDMLIQEIISSPSPKKISGNKKTLIYGVIILLVVIFGSFGYSYIITKNELDGAAEQIIRTAQSDYRITNLSLFPLSADLLSITVLKNTSKYELDFDVVMNTYIDTTFLAQAKGNLFLQSGEIGTLELTTKFGTEKMQDLIESGETPRTKLTMTVTTKIWGFVPITITKTEN